MQFPSPLKKTVTRTQSKKIPVVLTTTCITATTVLAVGGMALIVASKQRISEEVNNVDSARVLTAKANLQAVRKVYLEKLSRTDYTLGTLRNSVGYGQPNQVGWRQEVNAAWAQQLRDILQRDIDNPKNIRMYRMHMTPALQSSLLKTYQDLAEASSGDTRYVLKKVRSDGTTTEEKLPRAAFISLNLNKFEAIDLATNLDSYPKFNVSGILSQIRNVQQEYLVRLGAVLEAQDYQDPLDQLNNINSILDAINREETGRRKKKLEKLNSKPSQGGGSN
ncbi:MAG: hypothetical protein KME64_42875 [Scytonematopsis contorta HA4267-MV1]|jgi:hypothetical protein|nr:hypothetical protein [Scytonematopsis contorta HA4267-MV1]